MKEAAMENVFASVIGVICLQFGLSVGYVCSYWYFMSQLEDKVGTKSILRWRGKAYSIHRIEEEDHEQR